MLDEKKTSITKTHGETPWPVLTIDYAYYEKLLENSDASDEEKREFIQTLWNLIVNFVDLGFGIHPLQQACEQPKDLSIVGLTDVLGLEKNVPRIEFTQAVNQEVYHEL